MKTKSCILAAGLATFLPVCAALADVAAPVLYPVVGTGAASPAPIVFVSPVGPAPIGYNVPTAVPIGNASTGIAAGVVGGFTGAAVMGTAAMAPVAPTIVGGIPVATSVYGFGQPAVAAPLVSRTAFSTAAISNVAPVVYGQTATSMVGTTIAGAYPGMPMGYYMPPGATQVVGGTQVIGGMQVVTGAVAGPGVGGIIGAPIAGNSFPLTGNGIVGAGVQSNPIVSSITMPTVDRMQRVVMPVERP
jgi:hypothetical protein